MMWSGMEGMGWGWIGLGLVHMVVFWGLVIGGIVLAIRWVAGQPGERSPRAVDILRERYARGEIDKDEFEAKKQELAER